MTKICTLLAAVALTLAACGSAAPTATGTVPATVTTIAAPASSTTKAVTTTTHPKSTSTTVAPFSRDSRLAVLRCNEALGSTFALEVILDARRLTTAQSLCKEAAAQVEVDRPTSGSRGGHMSSEMDYVNGALAYADITLGFGSFDDKAQKELQDSVDGFDKTVVELFG